MSNPDRKRRVGIMGGTFDPIHVGHLILGESAYQQFQLNEVLFMPSGNPPHKRNRSGGATNEQRVEMVRLAIAGNPHFSLSLEEMHEEGYIYTSKTLQRLHKEHPDTAYYFIMGADSLLQFDTWREPQTICDHCHLVAAVRNNLSMEALDQAIRRVQTLFHASIFKLSTPNIDIASHEIRSWIAQGHSCRYYLTEEVRNYIFDQGLYTSSEGVFI